MKMHEVRLEITPGHAVYEETNFAYLWLYDLDDYMLFTSNSDSNSLRWLVPHLLGANSSSGDEIVNLLIVTGKQN